MQTYNKEVDVRCGQMRVKFNYSYNNDTKYQDLLEYVCSLFPNFNLCPCYIFANQYDYINSDTRINETDDINKTLYILIFYNDYKCHCNNNLIRNAYKKTKREIIEQFTNQNNNNINVNDYIKKINDLEMKDKLNNQRINNLEKEKYSQQDIISNLKNENNSLNQQINFLQKQKSEKENEIITLEKNIEKLEKEKNILQLAINGDFNSIDRLRKLGIEVNYRGENNMIGINPDNHQIIGKKEQSKVDFMNFYDVIIDIKSVKDINKGWEIKMSEKGLQNYRKFLKDKIAYSLK